MENVGSFIPATRSRISMNRSAMPAQVEYLRNYERLQDKTYVREFPVKYPAGTASEAPDLPPHSPTSARRLHQEGLP